MKQAALTNFLPLNQSLSKPYLKYILVFFAGLIGPLAFAPFHKPGFIFISLAIFFSQLLSSKKGLLLGFLFGLGYFGFGVSWVVISIHDYGDINYFFASLITLSFIAYLALFPALVGYVFSKIPSNSALTSALLFSILWCFSELLRSYFMTGFPWILVGTSLIDTPLKHLAPIFGIYGLSFSAAFCAALITYAFVKNRPYYLIAFILIIIAPLLLKPLEWTQIKQKPVSIGAVQANLAMRDKWDEQLFWNLLNYYEKAADKLLGKQLIIFPESAIPLPATYLETYLKRLHHKALKAKSALMLGILQAANENETQFYNSILSLGYAKGKQDKIKLVPFGEYIPKPFATLNHWLNLLDANIIPGNKNQELMRVFNHPIASLICYEVAYPHLLRQQLPKAHWIVSISDSGWFGHSLASYQLLQMSQMLSLLTGRYQVVVNNDGLSSIINTQGDIVEGLPAFSSGLLQGEVFESDGATLWVLLGDYPVFIFCLLCLFFILYRYCNPFLKQQQFPPLKNNQ